MKKAEIFLNNAEYDSSIYYYDHQLLNCHEYCHDTILADLYVKKAIVYKLNTNYESALINFKIGVGLFKKHKNINGTVNALTNLIELYRSMHNFEIALYHIEKVKRIISKEKVSKENRAYFYNRYAAVLTESTLDRTETIKYSTMAISIAKEIGNKDIEASSLNELAFIYKAWDYKTSFKYYFEALRIYEALGKKRDAAHVLLNISRSFHDLKDFKSSLKYCDKGLEVIRDAEWYELKKDFNYYKYRAHYNLKEFELAVFALENCRKYTELVLEFENDKNLTELQIKYEVQDKNNHIQLVEANANTLKRESEDKKREIVLIQTIVFLLLIILGIAVVSRIKIKKANRILEKTVDQKEILLQEVHHRVKNNLTLLNGLLFLRAKISDNQDVVSVLHECQSRVQAMSLVHQNLYNVEDSSRVDFNKFISELIIETKSLFSNENKEVSLNLRTNKIHFEMGFSIFLGLILNELITNSLKHAFLNSNQEEITISLSKNKGEFILCYSDSGNGLPNNFEIEKTRGFGFKLIKIMVKQINGKLIYDHTKQMFILKFKLK